MMHDGTTPYEGVLDAVKKLREAGKTLIVLSNSSKKKENSVKMLTKRKFETGSLYSLKRMSIEVHSNNSEHLILSIFCSRLHKQNTTMIQLDSTPQISSRSSHREMFPTAFCKTKQTNLDVPIGHSYPESNLNREKRHLYLAVEIKTRNTAYPPDGVFHRSRKQI